MESLGKNIQKFKRFLKEKGIYALYFREVKNNKHHSSTINCLFNGDIKAFLKHYDKDPGAIIDKSLYWTETANGHEFWGEIEYEFYGYLRNGKL